MKILVIGDVMLDHYIFGKTTRISPEAPVPVVHFKQEKYKLGGAANVANNLIEMGAEVDLIGLIGKDNDAITLKQMLLSKKIGNYLQSKKNITTTKKTRVIGNNNQIARIDYEKLTHEYVNINKNLDKYDVVIISDYNKGVVNDLLVGDIRKSFNGFIVVDPKGKDWSKYFNADYITPNEKELKIIIGDYVNDDELIKKAKKLIKKLNLKGLLVTRSEKGILLIQRNKHFPYNSEAKSVFDVSGAGDSVIASFSINIFKKQAEEAAYISNIAGSISVSKFGTNPVSNREIELLLNSKSEESYHFELNDLKSKGKKIVFTNGCFDLLHKGHIDLLTKSKSFGNILVVGLNSDKSVKKIKGDNRPIIDQETRKKTLLSLGFIDFVLTFDDETPARLISKIKPDVLVKGGDYKINEIVGSKTVLNNGGRVEIVKILDGHSTSDLEKIFKNTS